MAKAGDAPEGLVAQKHAVPNLMARIRRAKENAAIPKPNAALEREAVQNRNDQRWMCWQEIRRLEREKSRLEDSERVAMERERERKLRLLEDKRRIVEAETPEEKRAAVVAATSIDTIYSNQNSYAAALVWAHTNENLTQSPGLYRCTNILTRENEILPPLLALPRGLEQ